MSDLPKPEFKNVAGKQYAVPAEMVARVPMLHSNHVYVGVSGEEVSFTFCNKLDQISTEDDSNIAVPLAVVYLTLPQASALSEIHATQFAALRAVIEDWKTQQEKAVAER